MVSHATQNERRPVRRYLLFAGLFLLPIVVTGIRLGLSHHANTPDRLARLVPEVSVDEMKLDFGEAWVTDRFSWTIPVQNSGKADVEIANISAGCGCTQIEAKSLLIPAGQSRDLVARIDLRKAIRAGDGEASPFDVNITAHLSSSGTPIQWKLHGIVKRRATIEPAALHFGTRSRLAPQFESKTISMTFHQAVSNLRVEAVDPVVSVEVVDFDESSRRATLRVTPQAKSEGAFHTQVVVSGETGGNAMKAIVELPVSGAIGNDVVASPAAILYGIVEPGTRCEATISLRSQTGRSYSIDEITKSSESVDVTHEMPEASNGSVVLIQEVAEAVGFHLSTITFHVRCDDGLLEQIEVPVRYVGRNHDIQ